MKELLGSAFNAQLTESDGKLLGLGEVILVLSEPIYAVDVAGQMNKTRTVFQTRFGATAKSIRLLVDSLESYADALEELEERASITTRAAMKPRESGQGVASDMTSEKLPT